MEANNNSEILRKYTLSDLEIFLEGLLNKEVFYSLNDGLGTEKEMELWRTEKEIYVKIFNSILTGYNITNPSSIGFGIIELDSLIGGVCCGNIFSEGNAKTGEVSYWLNKNSWGKGIATRALNEFSTRLFDDYNLNCLSALTSERNLSSQKVLEKNGFVLEEIVEGNLKKYTLRK